MRPVLAALAALLVLATPAAAGTYTVHSCDSGSTSGWSPGNGGLWVAWHDGCAGGGALTARVTGWPSSFAQWTFTAPSDTDIAGFSLLRSWWTARGIFYGTPIVSIETSGAGDRYRNWRANFADWPVEAAESWEGAAGLSGQTQLHARVECGGGGSCVTENGVSAWLVLRAARIDLRDRFAPRVTAASPARLAGVVRVGWSAEDRGGGVERAVLRVDGRDAVSAPAADADGTCRRPFRNVVPCPRAVSGELALDTRALAEGRHEVDVRVLDAAGNEGAAGPWRVEVDNVAPPRPDPPHTPPPHTPPPGGPPPVGPGATPPGDARHGDAPRAATRDGLRVHAWLEARGRRLPRLTVRYGRAVTLRGQVLDVAGNPVPSAALAMAERNDGGRWRARTGLRTTSAGDFEATIRPGRNRRIRLAAARTATDLPPLTGRGWPPAADGAAAPPSPLASAALAGAARLRLLVRAPVTLAARRAGASVAVTGRVRGGRLPARGARVEIQVRERGRWVGRLVVRTRSGGRFRGTVPWRGGRRPALRALAPRQPGLPFAKGSAQASW
jgi:hypothetical protein